MAVIRTNTNSQFSTSFLDHSQSSSPMAASFRPKSRVFEAKDQVEVCSMEQGFVGSYYAATVVANVGNNYVVEYKNLVEEDDEGTKLRETVKTEEVRPTPPSTQTAKKIRSFRLGDVVDAFDNDGWWVGVVTGKRGIFYTVFFETSWEHIAYPVTRLRPHLEWRKEKWSYCKNRESFIGEKYFISKGVVKSILDDKMGQLRKITQPKVPEEEDGDGESSVKCKKGAHESSSEVLEPCILKKPRLS